MTPAEFKILRTTLGLTTVDVAEAMDVALRTAQRWESSYTPPEDVQAWILTKWGLVADRVGEVLDLAEQGEPIRLIAYCHDSQCAHLGMSASEHAALLGHIMMALTQCDLDWELVEAPR